MNLVEKIKSIKSLERGRTYVITIKDAYPENIDAVVTLFGNSCKEFGCKFIVISDRYTFEEIHDYMQRVHAEVDYA